MNKNPSKAEKMSKPFQKLSEVIVKMVKRSNNEQRNCSLWIMPEKVIDMQKCNKKTNDKRKRMVDKKQ